jgi:hypothetical protein
MITVRTIPAAIVAQRLFNKASMPHPPRSLAGQFSGRQDSKFITPVKCAF